MNYMNRWNLKTPVLIFLLFLYLFLYIIMAAMLYINVNNYISNYTLHRIARKTVDNIVKYNQLLTFSILTYGTMSPVRFI